MNIIVKQMHNVVMIKVENLPENMVPFYDQYYSICKENNKPYFLRCCPQDRHEMGEDYLNIGQQDSGNYLAYAFSSVDEANIYVRVISELFKPLKKREEKINRAEQMMRETMRPDYLK